MKKLTLLSLTILTALSLSACGSTSHHKSSTSSHSSSKVVKKHHKKKQNKQASTNSSAANGQQQNQQAQQAQQTQPSQANQSNSAQGNPRAHSDEDIPGLAIAFGEKGDTAYEYHTQGMPTQADADSAGRTAESLNQAGVYGNVGW